MGPIKIFGQCLFAVLVAGACWVYGPWSDYSPARVIEARDTLDRVPYYRTMAEYFPHNTIAASPKAYALERDLYPTALTYSYGGETRDLDDYAARRDITGLIVVRDEKVIIERYWRGADVDDHHTSWSVAKSFVATLVGIALKEGAIEDLTDPVVKYAPIYRGTDYGQTTSNIC